MLAQKNPQHSETDLLAEDPGVSPVDPVYGAEVAYYPSDRLRLLLIGGAVYFPATFVINLAFASVDAATASIIVISAMAGLALVVGWWMLHQWNREITLYERGFSYREGSRNVYFLYSEVRTVQQEAQRVRYFGGLIRRTITRMTLTTSQDETLVIDRTYRKIDELMLRMEGAINKALHPIIEAKLANGSEIAFGGVLLSQVGVRVGEQRIAWDDYAGYRVGEGRLMLDSRTGTPLHIPLNQLENAALLVELLRART